MRKWIDFVAILALAFVWVIGSLLMKQGVSIPDAITLMLFGGGMVSSAILLKTNYPLNIGNPPTFLRNRGGNEKEAGDKNELPRLQRSDPRW